MTKYIGSQTRIGTILPGAATLSKIHQPSKEASLRLRWIDWYKSHGSNAALTCRRFGIHRSLFYKWYKRYKQCGLRGLESQSNRPRKLRTPVTPNKYIDLVRRLRRANPEYSKYKLEILLKREYNITLSPSTIGRIIKRYNLFFETPIKPIGHPDRVFRRRKPKGLKPNRPGQLIEFDVKHIPMTGAKRYGFVAIDVATRQALVHVSTSISSAQAAIAWNKLIRAWGKPQAVLNDNGSENLGAFQKLLSEQDTDQYFARPYTPKDKPHVERFIGSLERECIQWGGLATDLADQQAIIDTWLDKYHNYRPHQALGYLTPNEYKAKLESEVSTML